MIYIFHIMFCLSKIYARLVDTGDGEHPPGKRIPVDVDAENHHHHRP